MRIIMDPKISWDLKTVFRIGFVVSFTHKHVIDFYVNSKYAFKSVTFLSKSVDKRFISILHVQH